MKTVKNVVASTLNCDDCPIRSASGWKNCPSHNRLRPLEFLPRGDRRDAAAAGTAQQQVMSPTDACARPVHGAVDLLPDRFMHALW